MCALQCQLRNSGQSVLEWVHKYQDLDRTFKQQLLQFKRIQYDLNQSRQELYESNERLSHSRQELYASNEKVEELQLQDEYYQKELVETRTSALDCQSRMKDAVDAESVANTELGFIKAKLHRTEQELAAYKLRVQSASPVTTNRQPVQVSPSRAPGPHPPSRACGYSRGKQLHAVRVCVACHDPVHLCSCGSIGVVSERK